MTLVNKRKKKDFRTRKNIQNGKCCIKRQVNSDRKKQYFCLDWIRMWHSSIKLPKMYATAMTFVAIKLKLLDRPVARARKLTPV